MELGSGRPADASREMAGESKFASLIRSGLDSCFRRAETVYAIRHLRAELEAYASAALTAPFGRLLCGDTLHSAEGASAPVVLVHGLLGNRVHFRALRKALERREFGRFASFCYGPRIDYRTLAGELGLFIDGVCERTGVESLDVIGHSLGGLVSRYLVETTGGPRVRRLVTLGSPYYGNRFPGRELSIFAANDVLIRAPAKETAARRVVIPDCGHMGLLHSPAVHDRIAAHLSKEARPRRSRSPLADVNVARAPRPPRPTRIPPRGASRTVTSRKSELRSMPTRSGKRAKARVAS